MKEIVDYIIGFLVGVDSVEDLPVRIGYTNDFREFDAYDVVIKASGFFDDGFYGTKQSLPTLPLKIWDELPIIYGDTLTEVVGNTLVIGADLVASTYFLISRYEEMVRTDVNDHHNRFPGKASLPYRAGFIDKPIVEQWGLQLRDAMREHGFEIAEPAKKIKKVYLTHDVDQLAHFRTVRGLLGGVLRGIKRPKEGKSALKSFFGRLTDDPWYTFPFLFKLNNELQHVLGKERCETVVFIRSTGMRYKEDKPYPNLLLPDYKYFIRYCKRKDVTIGLHTSYECGIYPQQTGDEKNRLEKSVHREVVINRNHFMNNRGISNLTELLNAGITEDFSMGYADIAGFRLGTCKPVRFINPQNKQLTPLVLHSLTVMDRTLSDKRYMYMNAHDAYQYCEQLIDTVERYGGEISLLWHNNLIEKSPNLYHRKLYADLINYLKQKL